MIARRPWRARPLPARASPRAGAGARTVADVTAPEADALLVREACQGSGFSILSDAAQQVRNTLVLLLARNNRRPVAPHALHWELSAQGLLPVQVDAALRALEREGLARRTPEGWADRPAALPRGVTLDFADRVRLRHERAEG